MAFKGDTENDGLEQMRLVCNEYLKTCKDSKVLQEFLNTAQSDEKLLLWFLKGRKHNVKHAWESLKRYAQVRFDIYPHLFPEECPEKIKEFLCSKEILGALKSRDKFGRRVFLTDLGPWDPAEYSSDEFNVALIKVAEMTKDDQESLENGFIVIGQCLGLNRNHAKEFTFSHVRRSSDLYLHAFPLKVKGVFILNTPYFFTYIANLIRFFFPKKLRDRLTITSSGAQDCKELQELLSMDQLPKSFGGTLEFWDAVEDPKLVF